MTCCFLPNVWGWGGVPDSLSARDAAKAVPHVRPRCEITHGPYGFGRKFPTLSLRPAWLQVSTTAAPAFSTHPGQVSSSSDKRPVSAVCLAMFPVLCHMSHQRRENDKVPGPARAAKPGELSSACTQLTGARVLKRWLMCLAPTARPRRHCLY